MAQTSQGATFTALASFGGTNGAEPFGTLAQGTNGYFFGTSIAGGANNQGTVFVAAPSGTISALYSFTNGSDGVQPRAGLIQVSDGNFYGTASAGGNSGLGTVFSISPGGDFKALASFDGTNTGAQPYGKLLLATNGVFYGTTLTGGTNGLGTVFMMTTNWELTTLYNFDGTNGASPQGGLVQGSNGLFYGTAAVGGSRSLGTVFSLTADGAITLLHSFAGGSEGIGPQGGLTQGKDGNFYGTTIGGGSGGVGTAYRITPDGSFSTRMSFAGTNGAGPVSELTLAVDGTFYGTTFSGGAEGSGTAFNVTTSGALTTLYNFGGGNDGGSPRAGLIAGADGHAYGVTTGGGRSRVGTFYRLSGFLPVVVVPPQDITVTNGDSAIFSIMPSGEAPLTFQWQFNSNNLSNSRRIFGVKTPTLTISNTSLADVGRYSVVVTGPAGSVSSSSALLSVVVKPTVTILSPRSPRTNEIFAKTMLPVIGRATTGNVAIASVNYRVNEGLWNVATTVDSWAHWKGNVAVIPGTNVLQAYGEDIVGKRSLTNTVSFIVADPFFTNRPAYYGLFSDTNGITPQSSGFFSLRTTEKATFTGRLQIGNDRLSMRGQFDTDGNAQSIIARSGSAPLTVRLHLDLDSPVDQISGTVSNADWVADLLGYAAGFDGRARKAPQAGRWTMVMPGAADATTQPGGDSYATIGINDGGMIVLNGSLADGTRISQSVPLSAQGQWPFYTSLYAGRGSLIGWLSIPPETNEPAGELAWIKPAMADAKTYPGGFTNSTEVSGARFRPPGSNTNVLSFLNGQLVLSGGDLAEAITNAFTLGAGNRVTDLSGNKLRLSFSRSNGSFRGSVSNPANSQSIPFSGVVLQDEDTGVGYFLEGGLSGKVFVGAAP